MKEITEQEEVKSFIYSLQVMLKGYVETIGNTDNTTIAIDNVKSFVNELIEYIETRTQDIKYLN